MRQVGVKWLGFLSLFRPEGAGLSCLDQLLQGESPNDCPAARPAWAMGRPLSSAISRPAPALRSPW